MAAKESQPSQNNGPAGRVQRKDSALVNSRMVIAAASNAILNIADLANFFGLSPQVIVASRLVSSKIHQSASSFLKST